MSYVKGFLTILLLASSVFIANGQKSVKKSDTLTSPALCQVSGLNFQCPEGFSAFLKDDKEGLFLFREDKDKNFGLFVSVPNQILDENELLNDLTKNIVTRLFPTQLHNYEWADSEVAQFGDRRTPMSKNQISSKTIKGYNKTHLLFANFRHINFNEKHFIVGYFIEMEKGKKARKQFQNNFLYCGYSNCDAQRKLIYSITGEKLDERMNPCEVVINV